MLSISPTMEYHPVDSIELYAYTHDSVDNGYSLWSKKGSNKSIFITPNKNKKHQQNLKITPLLQNTCFKTS